MVSRVELPPPPPPLIDDSSLRERTFVYWTIMLICRGLHPKEDTLSVGSSLDSLRRVSDNTDPKRPLAKLVRDLRSQIVEIGGSTEYEEEDDDDLA